MSADTPTLKATLGAFGVWSATLKSEEPGRRAEIADAAAELDELGYGAIWLGGSPGVEQAVPLLDATRRITVATGILSIWLHSAEDVAARYADADESSGGRFLLGLGVSHGALTDRYRKPYSAMRDYLTALDDAPRPVPAGRRVLAALGPKMLELSRDRAAGAHPYLVTAEHTAQARATLGEDTLLAPELKAVLDPDPARALATARAYLSRYLALPNYTNNLLRLGFAEEDLTGGGSDRLVHALFALGEPTTVRARAEEFLAAGADHVALQVVTGDGHEDFPLAAYRALAEALPLK
ncbi:LLM class F420-dependent oxidoreductase [Streptomyces sp. NPDC127098]|uniref:LLM class F420-dependent oxidoreductase n=1 Tax=Streptomyces sp. NPDC127098 TaxID=3347137 RepID=UPI003656BB4C